MNVVAAVLVLVVGLIQLLPGVGAFRPDFQSLYGVDVAGSDLVILMRNRAVYIAVLGALLIYSAFRPQLRLAAVALSVVCLGSFVVLAAITDHGGRIRQLMIIDVVLVFLLLAAAVAHVAADA